MGGHKAFRYPLEPLRTKKKWDMDVAQLQCRDARDAVERQQGEVDELLRTIAHLEQEIRDTRSKAEALDRHKLGAQAHFLRYQHEMHAEKSRELDRLRRVYERVEAQLLALKRSLDGLDKHKENQRRAFDVEMRRKELVEADDTWLMRLPTRRGK